ncbi:Protein RTF2 [Blomia tropicalis]|nr:Protein RTF2 [Blomia tropicalis]
MGCDGGTIPRRDELVRTKKKKEEKDKKADIVAKWKYCAISSNKLTKPIVSCELGRLYNKDAVIEYLLNKESPNSSLISHIRNLKDIVTLGLTLKQDYKEKDTAGDKETDLQDSKYVCPIVGLEMNGMYKFFYIRTCGCVLSERAIKEVKTDNCLVCNKPFVNDDLILLNGNDEEIEELRLRMIERRNKAKEERKKKRKLEGDEKEKNGRKDQKTEKDIQSTSGSTNGQSSSSSSNVKTSSLAVLQDKASKKYSVSKDPNASETYKSLFTSHESAKNRPKAHWVTFNPCYN